MLGWQLQAMLHDADEHDAGEKKSLSAQIASKYILWYLK